MTHDKFLLFLESMITESNKSLIESLKEGYLVCFEGTFGSPDEFIRRNVGDSPINKIRSNIDKLQGMSEKYRDDDTMELLDKLMGLIKAKKYNDALYLYDTIPITYTDTSEGKSLHKILSTSF